MCLGKFCNSLQMINAITLKYAKYGLFKQNMKSFEKFG
jgi:hypothetical protein